MIAQVKGKSYPSTRRCFALTTIALLVTGVSWGQVSRGTILGTIFDPGGNAIPGARVTAHEVAAGYERTSPTSTLGDYEFTGLPIGQYTITVEAKGFTRESRQDI